MTIYPPHIRGAVVDIAKIVEADQSPRCFDKIAERLVKLLAEARAVEAGRPFVPDESVRRALS